MKELHMMICLTRSGCHFNYGNNPVEWFVSIRCKRHLMTALILLDEV